jgi:2'-5' RNA ligase
MSRARQEKETMRLFIAINLSEQTRKILAGELDKMRSFSTSGQFVAPQNLHLTLVFLGECDSKETDAIVRSMNTARFEPFVMTILGVSCHYRQRHKLMTRGKIKMMAKLVFCGLVNDTGYEKVRQLQSLLSVNLSAKNFRLDQRKFWPHITLGRKFIWKDDFRFGKYKIGEYVTSIELMKSERVKGKLTYTTIHRKALG